MRIPSIIRRCLRYRLRTALLVMTVTALALGYFRQASLSYQQEQLAIQEIPRVRVHIPGPALSLEVFY